MAKYCRYCGGQLNEASKFCVNCGKPTEQSGASAQGQPAYRPPTGQPKVYQQPVNRPQTAQQPPTFQPPVNPQQPRRQPTGQPPVYQPGYGQPGYAQQTPYPQQPAQSAKKKRPARAILVSILCVALVAVAITGFIAPGFFLHKGSDGERGGPAVVTTAELVLPKPTAAEALVNVTAYMGIEYYNVARMYLEKLISFDPKKGTPEELDELVNTTIAAFEKAEKMSEAMEAAVDVWMNTDEERGTPTFRVTTETFGEELSGFELFPMTVYAKEDSPAVKWARDITERYDKAPAGKGIRTLASQLGTDAKHAYA